MFKDILKEFIKALVTGGSFAVVLAVVSFVQTRRRDIRDGLFKAFDSYLKIMDYRRVAMDKCTWEAWFHYYRALFDLQWSEFQSWQHRAIPDKPYRVWLKLRFKHYNSKDEEIVVNNRENTPKPISYRIAWDMLIKPQPGELPYFDSDDPFVKHMEHVHNNDIEKALAMKPRRFSLFSRRES